MSELVLASGDEVEVQDSDSQYDDTAVAVRGGIPPLSKNSRQRARETALHIVELWLRDQPGNTLVVQRQADARSRIIAAALESVNGSRDGFGRGFGTGTSAVAAITLAADMFVKWNIVQTNIALDTWLDVMNGRLNVAYNHNRERFSLMMIHQAPNFTCIETPTLSEAFEWAEERAKVLLNKDELK